MREIKFRLRENNIIIGYEKWYSGHFTEEEGQTANPCWLYSKDNKRWTPNYIFHKQKDCFINLSDKNSKEIYGGDIVKVTDKDNEKKIFSVKSDGMCFYGENKNGNYDIRFMFDWGDIFEVIGNIWENGELLK